MQFTLLQAPFKIRLQNWPKFLSDYLFYLIFSTFSGVKIQFFEPITVASHQEFILVGCLEMKSKTGELVFKPPLPSPTQPSEIPLVFTNLTKSTLSKNLLGEIILIRQPHLIISESVNGQNRDYIRVFGHWCVEFLLSFPLRYLVILP